MTDHEPKGRPSPTTLRLADLPQTDPTPFSVEPDAEARRRIAEALGIDEFRKLRFSGTLAPEGRRDWRLDAELGATVVQPCVVTLAPVVTRIDTGVTRRYVADLAPPEPGTEIEMPEDDTAEPLPHEVDLAAVMTEALALALPDYPRAPDAELGPARATPPGAEPLSDEDTKPFAGLAGLRDKLRGEE